MNTNNPVPSTEEDIRELAEWAVTRDSYRSNPDIFVGYLIGDCGLDAKMVERVLRPIWPEAAAKVEL